jgi:hypothetical protein
MTVTIHREQLVAAAPGMAPHEVEGYLRGELIKAGITVGMGVLLREENETTGVIIFTWLPDAYLVQGTGEA